MEHLKAQLQQPHLWLQPLSRALHTDLAAAVTSPKGTAVATAEILGVN